MRRLALLAVVPALLLSFVVDPARADDEALERLEKRVALLLDIVTDLRKEVIDLRMRVTGLETTRTGAGRARRVDVSRVAAEPERVVESAVPSGVVVVEPEVGGEHEVVDAPEMGTFPGGPSRVPSATAGVYVVDARASIDAIVARASAGSPEEEAAVREMAEQTFGTIQMELELKADGTFAARMSGMGDEERTAGGTWNLVGENLTMVTTHENGEKKETADDISGTWKDGRLTMSEDGDEFVVVFVRKPH